MNKQETKITSKYYIIDTDLEELEETVDLLLIAAALHEEALNETLTPRLLIVDPIPRVTIGFHSWTDSFFYNQTGFLRTDAAELYHEVKIPPTFVINQTQNEEEGDDGGLEKKKHSFEVNGIHCFLYMLGTTIMC